MNRNVNRNKSIAEKKEKRSNVLLRLLVAAATFILIFFILISTAVPRRQKIEEGQIAQDTIKAPRDVLDKYTTDIKVQSARDNVNDKFTQDDKITASVQEALEACFVSMQTVREMGAAEKKKKQEQSDSPASFVPYDSEFLDKCREEVPSSFSPGDIIALLELDKEEFILLSDKLRILINDAMEAGIKEDTLNDQTSNLSQQLMSSQNNFSENAHKVGMSVLSAMIKANFLYDPVATETARDAAEKAVEPEMYRHGQNIIRGGETITKAQIEVLKDLGYIDDGNKNYGRYLSLFIIELLIFIVFGLYISFFHKNVARSIKSLITIGAIAILSLLFSWAGTTVNNYIVPVYFSAFICAMMMEKKSLALVLNVMLSILVTVMSLSFGEIIALPILIASIIGGSVTVIALRSTPQRATIMLAGILAGLASGVVYVVFAMINFQSWMDMLFYAGMGLTSGMVSSILAIGTLPMWETVFRMITPMKLLELANPNQPLLKKLLNDAPGTYHHSIMVGNMAERAAEAIGANSLIVRAGAYYHDIGKLKRPYFFVENQQGRNNPHDNIKPDLSTRIITSHLTDGLELVKKAKVPQVIQDIVAQHHGNTAVMYFYHKTKTNAENPEDINLDDFRYKGTKPVSREAAILMLADSVEAAVRSLDNPSAKSVKEMIEKIFKSRLDDGQLDNCELTLREMRTVLESFMTALTGLYHERVEYPSEKDDN